MNWNEYREAIDQAEFDPAFQKRALRALAKASQGGKEQNTMKHTKKTLQRVLIAAAIVVFATVVVFAASVSLRSRARQDMGLSQEKPIAEWTEFDENEITAENEADGHVECVSTLCSGDACEIYLLVDGVDAALAADIVDDTVWCEWDIGHVDIGHNSGTVGAFHVAYDADTQQALVRVSASSVYFETADELKMELVLRRDGEIERAYGEIVIPLTQSQALEADIALPLESDGRKGSLTGVRVYAGYVEVLGTCPSLAEAGIDEAQIEAADAFIGGWSDTVSEVLSGAELVFADGSRAVIAELPSPLAGEWIFAGNVQAEQGQIQMRHVCEQALDLTQITAVVIGGQTYPLS